ncbi:MAG: glutathione S-transferase C-terminal domain-containing protein [Bradyrhizobium sp.]
MKLYYAPGACSLADHIALIAAGIDHSTEKVDLKVKTTESGKDYRTINPKGYVPALELDDGQILTENIAVLLYIAHSAHKLLPDGFARWRVIETIAYISTEVHKSFKPLFDPNAENDAKGSAKQLIRQRLDYLEGLLGGRPFIVGDRMTIADCYLFVMLCWCRRCDIPLPKQLLAYFHLMEIEPAVAAAMTKEGLR